MLKEILYAVVLLIAVPVALLLAWLTKEELKKWRKRFYIIVIVALISSLIFLFTDFVLKIPVILGLIFIIIIFVILIIKAK